VAPHTGGFEFAPLPDSSETSDFEAGIYVAGLDTAEGFRAGPPSCSSATAPPLYRDRAEEPGERGSLAAALEDTVRFLEEEEPS
jgi:hypothetical protein